MTAWHSELEEIRAHYQRMQGKTRPETEQFLGEMLTFNADARAILTHTHARGAWWKASAWISVSSTLSNGKRAPSMS